MWLDDDSDPPRVIRASTGDVRFENVVLQEGETLRFAALPGADPMEALQTANTVIITRRDGTEERIPVEREP